MAEPEQHGVVLDPLDAPRADVVFHVLDARTRQPIANATIRFANDLEPTDGNGQARFPSVLCQSDPYGYLVHEEGYEETNGSLVHTSEQGSEVTVDLQPAAVPAGGGTPPAETPPTGETPPAAPPGTADAGGAGSASQHTSQILKRGSRGPAVVFLQEQLNDEGASLQADGIFGSKTQAAVKKFQQAQGLTADGIVGPNTWAALMDSGASGINLDSDVQQARDLQSQFDQARDAAQKGRIARELLAIATRVERRLSRAPKDANGRPTLTGDVQWAANATGVLADIPPFGNKDQWAAASAAAPPPPPPRDRTVQTRMGAASDYDSFRTAVAAWIGRFVSRSRAGALVDASNLRELHRALFPNPNMSIEVQIQLSAQLDAGPARYESVRFSSPDANVAPAADQSTQGEDGGICTDPSLETPDGGMSVDPADQSSDDGGVCVDPSMTLEGGTSVDDADGGVCVDETPVGPAAPVCGGDDTGDNTDHPVTVDAPYGTGGSAFDDSNVTFNASGELIIGGRVVSQSNFPGGRSGTVAMDAGQSGQVRIHVAVEAFQDAIAINETMRQEFSVTWDISTDQQGGVTITSPAPDIGAQSGGTWMRLDSINPDSGRTHVQVSPKVIGPSASGGISVGVGVENAAAASAVQKTFRLSINVCNIPEPAPEPVRTPRTHRVSFERPRQADVSAAEERKLIAWYSGLSAAARASVESGDARVDVTGYASTTGGEQMNRELSAARAANVVAILRSYASSRLNANSRGRGEYQAATGDNVEDDAERRAEISIVD